MESGGSAAREGDSALADLLLAHGLVMNGGVGHALEALSSDQLAHARANRAKEYLERHRNMDVSRVVAIDGFSQLVL